MSYFEGIMPDPDRGSLERCMDVLCKTFPEGLLHICEIGVLHGGSARGFYRTLTERSREIVYTGVDVNKIELPFPSAQMIQRDSVELFDAAMGPFNFVFIDGCHCNNHVILDFCNFSTRLCPGGFIALHDANPLCQNRFDYQGHGPKDLPEFGSSVPVALHKMGLWPDSFARTDWKVILHEWDATSDWGGIILFQKTH